METTTYRFDHQTGEVYRYDEGQRAYLFVGSLSGRTEAEFIRYIEEREILDDSEE